MIVEPAFCSVPEHTGTAGPEAAELAGQAGLVLDAEQRLALDMMLAEGPRGQWAAYEFAVICARQNMKTVTFQAAALADLFLFGDRLVVWTAHRFRTTQEAFRDIKGLIEGSDFLRRRVRRITEANGEEGIELKSGARLSFLARSKSGGRGLSGDKVFLDEAFALGPAAMGSLLPTLSARPNPQVRYGSSAGLVDSEVLRGVRDRGRAGGDPSLAYVEWCAPVAECADPGCDHQLGTEGCALDDESLWQRANPAMGRRLAVDRIRAERRALPAREFARERLGWWEDPQDALQVLDPTAWMDLTDRGSKIDGPIVLAVDVAPDRSRAVIAAAGWRRDGRVHLELIALDRAVSWVVGDLVSLVTAHDPVAVVLHRNGPAGSLIAPLAAAGIEPVEMSGVDVAQASGGFYDAVTDGSLRHLGDPLLTEAVRAATRRGPEGSWSFDRKDARDIPLLAVALGRHALELLSQPRQSPPPAPRVIRAADAPNTSTFATAGF